MIWVRFSSRLCSLGRLLSWWWGGWSRWWGGWSRCCGGTGCFTLPKNIIFELRNIVCLLGDNNNRCTKRNEVFRSGSLGDKAFLLNLKSHSCFISLNLSDGISSLNFISRLFEPLENLTFLHGWRKSRHLTKENMYS